MIIIKSRINQGRIPELVKRFIQDPYKAVLISDEMDKYDVYQTYSRFSETDKFVGEKQVYKVSYSTLDEYLEIIHQYHTDNIYLDITLANPATELPKLIAYCKNLELSNNTEITLTVQLNANADRGIFVDKI